jgi:hypothetical protein
VNIGLPLVLSASGLVVAALAVYNRDKPAWQRDMRSILLVAIGQVALGAVAWILLNR